MARPLRIDVDDGWYAVAARGIERRTIFCDDRHCTHFLELLGEMSGRFTVGVHAYVLMGNHYHLITQTPHANLSVAMQWLNLSYSAWFNAKHDRAGHLFQGRFGSRLIDGDGSWVLRASVYLHLNPVRIAARGLDKQSNRAESLGLRKPTEEQIRKRLSVLREHSWSSYPAYAGYLGKPSWLLTKSILMRGGGREKYRRYVQAHVTRGTDPKEYNTANDQIIIGSRRFIEEMKKKVGKATKEQPGRQFLLQRVSMPGIVAIVEKAKGERWEAFRSRHGDWGRPLVLYLARRRSGLTLREIGDWLGGVDYKTVSKTVERFARKLEENKELAKITKRCMAQLSNVET